MNETELLYEIIAELIETLRALLQCAQDAQAQQRAKVLIQMYEKESHG